MVELIDKWEVVNKLIRLENNYQFYKKKWDADVLYRRICELEIGIGKTPGLEVVRCGQCKHFCEPFCLRRDDETHRERINMLTVDFCSYGERKDDER